MKRNCLLIFILAFIMTDGQDETSSWYKTTSSGETVFSNQQIVNSINAGHFQLELRWLFYNGMAVCTNSKNFKVKPPNTSTISKIEVKNLQVNNQITILAVGHSDYEYAIDEINVRYQNEPLIENIMPGVVTVYVREKSG